ncbi:MAG: deoxynucleoside kinase [Candidatus Gottesmanbacteria bacterium]|nr:deoxynucleoside kinase [Candidatus Gottesmanbacteria bacterium]
MNKKRSGAIIALLGTAGSGKSTFADHLGTALHATVYKEKTDGNPFQSSAHTSTGKIFENQVWFLLQSVHRWTEAIHIVKNGNIAIMDTYVPFNDFHSKLAFDHHSYALYEQLSQRLSTHMTQPNLVVYLFDTVDYLMDRLRRRNTAYDKNVNPEYLHKLQTLHDAWISSNLLPILRIRSRELENSDVEATHIADIRQRIQQ